MYQAAEMPAVQWGTTLNDFAPTGLSDPEGSSQVLMLSIPGEYMREGAKMAFADDANGKQSKKALSILVRLWLEGNRTIEKAKLGIGANESEDEDGKGWNKGKKKGKEGESSVGVEMDFGDIGGDALDEMDEVKNKEGSVRLIYMGLRCADNGERVLKHTWWLIKKGGGKSLDMNSRMECILEKNRRRENVFLRKKENNKLRPLMKGAAREQTEDTCITDVYRDWVLGSALWYFGYRVPEFLSLATQSKLMVTANGQIGLTHDLFPAKAKVDTVFNPLRGIIRGPRGKDRVEDASALRMRSYLCPSLAGKRADEIVNPWESGMSFASFLHPNENGDTPLIMEIRGPRSVSAFYRHCDPSYHMIHVLPALRKIQVVPQYTWGEDEFSMDGNMDIGLGPPQSEEGCLTGDFMLTAKNESASFLQGQIQGYEDHQSSMRTPLHDFRDWYARLYKGKITDHARAMHHCLSHLATSVMTDPRTPKSTGSMWSYLTTPECGVTGPAHTRNHITVRHIDASMSSFANLTQRFHLELEISLGIAVTHNMVATLKQSLFDVLFFKENKLMHNIMELGDAQSGKTHTMQTLSDLAIPHTVETVHHITTHAFTTKGPPIMHSVIACDEAPAAWFASTDGSSVRSSGNGNNPGEDIFKGILTSNKACVRRPRANPMTGQLEDGSEERLVAAAFWVCSNRPPDTFSPAMGSRFWQLSVNEMNREHRNISDKQIQAELDVDRPCSRPDTDEDPDFRARATLAFRHQQSIIFLCAVMQDFAGMSKPCKILVPIVVGRMKTIFQRYSFAMTPRITSQISRICNVYVHEDAYHRHFRTHGGLFNAGAFYPEDLFDRERRFESDLIITEDMVLQAVFWIMPQFLPFPLIRTMQLVLSCLEQEEWDYESLLMKPFEGNGEDNAATASDYQDGVNHEKAVMGRLDFDYIYVPAESLDEFAEKLVAHQRSLAAGKAEDGSVALSARVIVSNLRSLHETSFGQTRHAPLSMLIPDADGCLQSRMATDKNKFDYTNWSTTAALFKQAVRDQDMNTAYNYFPHEHTDCSAAAAAATDLDVMLATVTPTNRRASELHAELNALTTTIATASIASLERHEQWALDAVRTAAGDAAQLSEQMKDCAPCDWGLEPVTVSKFLQTVKAVAVALRSIAHPKTKTTTSFSDDTYKHKVVRLSTHFVTTLGHPEYLNNIRHKVMADYAHNHTISRPVLIGMSTFGQSKSDAKPYLLEYTLLQRNKYDKIAFPNQNFLDKETFDLMLPPDVSGTKQDRDVPLSMKWDYQGLNEAYTLDRMAAVKHLENLGIERGVFQMFWADRTSEFVFDRPVLEKIRANTKGGWEYWDNCMTQAHKNKEIIECLVTEYPEYLDRDPDVVRREIQPAELTLGATIDVRAGGWRRCLDCLRWRLVEVDRLPRDPDEPSKLLSGEMRRSALIKHRTPTQMRSRLKRVSVESTYDPIEAAVDDITGKRLKIGMSNPVAVDEHILVNIT